ncbi:MULTISPECIES: LysR family transcriptional regulator [unclassified Rhizobium]|uniref:LysR family transcriptional regulator n=1 Tax=unclassified Rhizobium TaxID=2613769 RepID=UPI000DDEA2B8|nr:MULTISPECIES: LysR family transcriptional regulator [unclassified Rhizobium]MBB3291199.1 DNA-binding transcriptional LysR family regulator [Rhizobium sp. BK252]MBB3405940.1 DNA-binding transcriptional LysR family regulator [Rhizobium sp. BK289]MBB3418534.1 DNA-binding transcriptional LysR family regulator [Rhizobium sp. BK284]MBB3486404.1 DNA-binding transcriptional LysR family regulator [Rhizobium sp. BK347]
MDDLPLADLVAFTAVARERSFREAARKRSVSASSLSEAVRRLEEKLAVRLLNRTTRSVTPTEAGERLMERLTPAMSEIAVALDDINSFRDSIGGTLRLNVPIVAAMVVMPDIISRFLKEYPAISVEIVAEDNFIDVVAAGYDAGIRYDERLEKDMIAVPIGPRQQRYVTAAAPAYLAANGTPQHPRDILEHRCIRHRFQSGSVAPWEFERNGETIIIAPPMVIATNSIDIECRAAAAGLGIIRTFREFVAPQIAGGDLVAILEEWDTVFSGPFLYYASRRHMPAPLRAFVDFLNHEQRRSRGS